MSVGGCAAHPDENSNVTECGPFDVNGWIHPERPKNDCYEGGRRTFDSLSRLENDRCRRSCLSKIAHIRRIRVAPAGRQNQIAGTSACLMVFSDGQAVSATLGRVECINSQEYSTSRPHSDANLVRPFLDGEHAAQVAVMAPKGKLKDPT